MIKMIKTYSIESVTQSIRTMRTDAGYSQNQLANLTGMSPSLISRYEKGERKPTVDRYMRIAEACGHQIQII